MIFRFATLLVFLHCFPVESPELLIAKDGFPARDSGDVINPIRYCHIPIAHPVEIATRDLPARRTLRTWRPDEEGVSA